METPLNDDHLRSAEERQWSEARRLYSKAMRMLHAAEHRALPQKASESIYEHEKLLARADLLYSAARELAHLRKALRRIANQIRLIAGETFGIRAQDMLEHAAAVSDWSTHVGGEYDTALKVADRYEQQAKEARKSYEKAKAEHRRRYGADAPDYDDFLIHKSIVEAEIARDAEQFDWDEHLSATGDDPF